MKSITHYQKQNIPKLYIMKFSTILIKIFCMLLLFISASDAIGQGPYPNTGNQNVCLNSIEPYGVIFHSGSTYAWSITPIAGGNGTIISGATPNLITVN